MVSPHYKHHAKNFTERCHSKLLTHIQPRYNIQLSFAIALYFSSSVVLHLKHAQFSYLSTSGTVVVHSMYDGKRYSVPPLSVREFKQNSSRAPVNQIINLSPIIAGSQDKPISHSFALFKFVTSRNTPNLITQLQSATNKLFLFRVVLQTRIVSARSKPAYRHRKIYVSNRRRTALILQALFYKIRYYLNAMT